MHPRSFVPIPVAALVVAAVTSCGDPVVPTAPRTAPPTEARLDVAPGAATGTWSSVINWPHVPAHMIGLPDGKVITWTSGDADHSHHTDNVHVWDPANPTAFKHVPNNTADVFCAGHSFLPDGNLMVAGGHITVDVGIDEAYLFKSSSASWAKTTLNMARGRWYPTTVTLGNGHVLVAAGNDANHLPNPLAEVWETSTTSDPSAGKWRLLEGASLVLPYYPRMHLAPDGRVFVAGPEAQTRWLNPSGSGAWTDGPVIPGGDRSEGTAVMYQPGKLLVFGGNDPATGTAYTLDLNVAGATWQPTGSLRYPRRHFSVQMLPDGRVLAIGGTGSGNSEGARVLASEVWDPATGQWTEWAPVSVTRTYHSSAVLLHDGRVLNGGGGRCGEGCPDYANAQIFTPPYLLKADGTAAARPTITGAPTAVGYGQSFTVQTPEAAAIARVSWVRLPAFTHAIDMNQRFVPLTFTKGTGQLTVSAPTNPNLAPPGHYMMFVLDGNGVPSVAKVVQVTGAAPLPALPAPAAPTNLVATAPTNTQASLTWADNSNSETSFRVERCTGAACTGFAEVGTTAPGFASYANTGLVAGTSYSFRVRAVNSTGFSSYSNVATVTTPTDKGMVPVVDRASGKCLDVLGGGVQPNGQDVWLWTCYAEGPVNQLWLVPPTGTSGPIRVYDNKCLDAWTAQGNSGDPIKIYDCIAGAANQQWTHTSVGELKGINGLCVNLAAGGSATDGSGYLALGACSDPGSRRWNIQTAAPPVDQPPVASFTPACTNLSCTFDSNASSDDKEITARRWTFGDGTTQDDGSVSGTPVAPTKTYAAAGTYGVTLTVTDAAGQTSSQTKSVSVTAPPVPAPVAPSGLTATLQTSTRVNLAWTDNSTTETAFHVERCVGVGCSDFVEYDAVAENATSYANTGLAAGTSYSYRVHAVNGSVASANSNVATVATPAANQPPAAGFTSTCTNLACAFTDASTDADGRVVGWSWSFGDSTTSTQQSPQKSYVAAGTYTVALTVTDDKGATGTVSKTVTVTAAPAPVDQPPVASFTAACTNLSCSFDSNASSDDKGITARGWTFGDQTTEGNVVAPAKTYAAAGTYAVTLTVTDAAGQSNSLTKSVTVTAPPPANATPTANFTFQCTDLACTFTDASSDGDGTVSAWSWSFGDGGTSTAKSPSHSYPSAGTRTVTLTVTDDKGATGTVSTVVTVTAPANQPPAAAFTQQCANLGCTFTDASTDADGTVAQRSWSFGDGASSTATNPTHTYAQGGTYTVTLTVTDDDGATHTASKSVTVAAPTAIDLSANAFKDKGYQFVQLNWSRATTTDVDIFRNGAKIITTPNDGAHLDDLRRKGGATYRYKVCEVGTATCSSEVTVVF